MKVYLTLRAGASVTEDELLEHCRQYMARFMVPDVIEIVDSFPRTPTGKIAKSQLSRERGVTAA